MPDSKLARSHARIIVAVVAASGLLSLSVVSAPLTLPLIINAH